MRHDLPLTVNDSVLRYLSFFTTPRGRAIVERGLERGGRYSAMIRGVLKQEGVPQDLIYLAQAESAFLPDAVSRAGARGIWQFMPFRGEEYGLERSYWIDERSDPVKATPRPPAPAGPLRNVWRLVSGDGGLQWRPADRARAIERTGYADFWELQKMRALPVETQNYVPIIIALALVSKDPGLYGVQVDPKSRLVDTVRRAIRSACDWRRTRLELISTFRSLNPELLRDLTPNQPNFVLNIPEGTEKKFEQNIHQVPEDKWTSWRLHRWNRERRCRTSRALSRDGAALENANHLEVQPFPRASG